MATYDQNGIQTGGDFNSGAGYSGPLKWSSTPTSQEQQQWAAMPAQARAQAPTLQPWQQQMNMQMSGASPADMVARPGNISSEAWSGYSPTEQQNTLGAVGYNNQQAYNTSIGAAPTMDVPGSSGTYHPQSQPSSGLLALNSFQSPQFQMPQSGGFVVPQFGRQYNTTPQPWNQAPTQQAQSTVAGYIGMQNKFGQTGQQTPGQMQYPSMPQQAQESVGAQVPRMDAGSFGYRPQGQGEQQNMMTNNPRYRGLLG